MYGRGRELGRARRRFDFSSVSTSCTESEMTLLPSVLVLMIRSA